MLRSRVSCLKWSRTSLTDADVATRQGYADETGEGAGVGANLNLPLPPPIRDDVYRVALAKAVEVRRAGLGRREGAQGRAGQGRVEQGRGGVVSLTATPVLSLTPRMSPRGCAL